MNTRDLLALLRESILNDRSDRASGTSDYLWTDQTLISFMNEAQRRFAVRGLVLRDGTTDEVTKITLVAGQSTYALHTAVIGVISARVEPQLADLTRVGHALMGAYRAPSETWTDPASLTALTPGAPTAFATDDAVGLDDNDSLSVISLRIFPTPAAAQDGQVLRLRVVRKPIEQLQTTFPTRVPEIPEDHHIEMLDWAAYLALRIVDDDAGSVKRAAEFAQSFESHVVEARALAMRKMFTPMPWGFGRGGFAWSN